MRGFRLTTSPKETFSVFQKQKKGVTTALNLILNDSSIHDDENEVGLCFVAVNSINSTNKSEQNGTLQVDCEEYFPIQAIKM